MLYQGRHRVLNDVWKIALVVVIPALVALFGGVWLAMRTVQERREHVESRQIQEVAVQARSLTDLVMGEIEKVRTEAVAIQKVHQVQEEQSTGQMAPLSRGAFQEAIAPFFNEIFYWAELEYDSAGVRNVRRSMKKPNGQEVQSAYAASIDDAYLLGALKNLDLDALRRSGVAMLRFKQEPTRSNEWLALVFDETSGGGKALFALVDPATAFTAISQFGPRSENGSVRAYLVGSDGYVLSHSKPAYIAADFSRTPLFRDALRFLFTRERISGSGSFRAIDESQVVVSYQRTGSLPLGVVVEKIKNVQPGTLPGGVVEAKAELKTLPLGSVLGWAGLWVAAWLWAVFVIQRTLMAMRPKVAPRSRDVEAEVGSEPALAAQVLVQSAESRDKALASESVARQKFSEAVSRGKFPAGGKWEEIPISEVPSAGKPTPSEETEPQV